MSFIVYEFLLFISPQTAHITMHGFSFSTNKTTKNNITELFS